ncbi:MAG TPA: hypothetical protein VFM78_05280 [Marinobacter sp.]|jgi:hypothetical protein|nr:hypothetical protein [Marinobacter sp.]
MSGFSQWRGRLRRAAQDAGPYMESSWREFKERVDRFNCALASQAVPPERRNRVSRMALGKKGQNAGQASDFD